MPPPPAAPGAPAPALGSVRRLLLALGDQLNADSALFDDYDGTRDVVLMAEVAEESAHVPSSRVRTALFLSAMRHFRDRLAAGGYTIRYHELGAAPAATLAGVLRHEIQALAPAEVRLVQPGDWRVRESLRNACRAAGIPLVELPDRHFFSSPGEFAAWAEGRKELRLEYFYRGLRRRTGILMAGDEPVGGEWNFDADNRSSFGRAGPGVLPAPLAFAPDALTRRVLTEVGEKLPDRAGNLARFDWPVTAAEAELALDDFIEHRLPLFGAYQDAMWQHEPWLYHSRLSAALNLKLLDPRRVVAAALGAHERGHAPLSAVEGFVRQILGWREFVRGLYWHSMPAYADRNALGATAALPAFYWTAETDAACLKDALTQTLELGYAHHIQRLMVTGLYALLLGVEPRAVHEWYLAVYVDAVEWVELPNVLGMSQYADGGLLASKPYIASGRYIDRMSNHCSACRFRPERASGADACPFTTLYWDFLDRHAARFRRHPRLGQQVRNLDRMAPADLAAIRSAAGRLRATGS